MSSEVWLVGDKDAPAKNQWQAMCPTKEAAEAYQSENPQFSEIKRVEVRPRRRRRARK